MLGNGEVASWVADLVEGARLKNVVVDPVLESSSGAALLDKAGEQVIKERFFPLADLITPNTDEAAALTGLEVRNQQQMELAATRLHEMGAKAVVITGGHLDRPIDVLSVAGGTVQTYSAERVDSPNTHGTGCAFSTAIACQLALGHSLTTAVDEAKAYVLAAIRNSYAIGRGPGPVNHMHALDGRSLRKE